MKCIFSMIFITAVMCGQVGTVIGKVTDKEGNVIEAQVFLNDSVEVVSDSSGYAFEGVTKGMHAIFVSSPGYVMVRRMVQVLADTTIECDFVLEEESHEPGSIKGYAEDLWTQRPLIVSAILVDSNLITESDSAGVFRFLDLEPGMYTLSVSASGYYAHTYPVIVRSGEEAVVWVVLDRVRE
jgi:hypothetical protein